MGSVEEHPEAVDIDLAEAKAQSAAIGCLLQDVVPKRLLEIRDVHTGIRRQPVERHESTGAEEHQREDGALLSAAEIQWSRVVGDFEGTENPKVEHLIMTLARSTNRVLTGLRSDRSTG